MDVNSPNDLDHHMMPRQLQYSHKGNNPLHKGWKGKGLSGHVSKINLNHSGDQNVAAAEQRILIPLNVKCRVRVGAVCSLFVPKGVEGSYSFIRPSMELESGGVAPTFGMDCVSFEQIMRSMFEAIVIGSIFYLEVSGSGS